jgi:hypothetical protein
MPGGGARRSVAEMIPSVTLPDRPSGLPMASTTSPACARSESPNVVGCSPDGSSARITARSSGGYVPTSRAVRGAVSPATWTWNSLALPATWALVTMFPDLSSTTPEPSPSGVRIRTTEGSTWRTTPA